MLLSIDRNRAAPGQILAITRQKFAGGAGKYLYNNSGAVLFFLFAVGAGDNFPSCTAKPGADGEGLLGPTVRANGGDEMINNELPYTLGAERTARRVPEPANPLPSGEHGRPRGGADRAASRG